MNDHGLIEFIEVLRENRCLWDPSDVSYTNRAVRKTAQMALLNVFQKYDPNANLAGVRRKIDSIRSTYLRERKKVENASSMSNEIFSPTLWYYDHLNFLSEVYKGAKSGADTPDTMELSFLEDDEEERQETRQHPGDDTTDFRTPPVKAVKRKRNSAQKQFLVGPEKVTNTPEIGLMGSWEAFGLSVGGDLRNLENKQQTIAQKLISDVIFCAKMGRLTEGSAVAETSVHLVSCSPSASSIMSPTPPACNASGPLSPYHDPSADTQQPSFSAPSKYSLQKDIESKTKYYLPNKQISTETSDITNQPRHPPQDPQEFMKES